MFCKKCGTEISDNVNFCPKCGEKVGNENNEQAMGAAVQEPVVEAPVQEPFIETPDQEPVIEAPVQEPVVGIPVQELSTNNISSINNKSKAGLIALIISLSVIALVLIIIGVLFATGILSFGKNKSDEENNNSNNGKSNQTEPAVKTKSYKLGDAVTTVDGSKWHIIGISGDNVTLLLDELVVEETGFGQTASEEDQKYVNSKVKKYIDETYMPELSNNIDDAGGDSSKVVGRIMNMDEYLSITYSKFDDNYYTTSHTIEAFNNKEDVCKMDEILSLTKSFWTSSNVRDYNSSASYFGVIYIKRGEEKYNTFCSKKMPEVYSIVDIATDGSYQYGATLIGIRPVIETPTSNIK